MSVERDYFPAAFAIVVGLEGGYVNDPRDPGGETKYGIAKRAHPELDIKNLTLEQAQDIYRREYWNAAACDMHPWEDAICTFDCAVNQGVGFAKATWIKSADVVDFMARRALQYANSPSVAIYGRGWMSRLFKVFREAQTVPEVST